MSFLKRAKAALRDETSLIIVKENTCEDGPDGGPKEFLDEEDSSLTRYVFLRQGCLFFYSTVLLPSFPSVLYSEVTFPRPHIAVLRRMTSVLSLQRGMYIRWNIKRQADTTDQMASG